MVIKVFLAHKRYALSIATLGIFAWSSYSICDSGDITLINLTHNTVYAGIYQYNYERDFNTKASFTTLAAEGSAKIFAPDLICIAKSQFMGISSCSSHSRLRLFVSSNENNNVIQYQQGIVDSSILAVDPSLWFMQVGPNKTYAAFNNGLFFDPWYATEGRAMGKSNINWKNQKKGAYLYPGRLNIIEKENNRFKVVSRYVDFEQWITSQ